MALQNRLSHPWIVRPVEETGLVARDLDVFGAIDRFFHVGPELLRLGSDRGDAVDRAWPEILERRAHAIAQESRIFIHAVEPRRDAALGQKGHDLAARDVEQRPDETVLATSMDPAQPRE